MAHPIFSFGIAFTIITITFGACHAPEQTETAQASFVSQRMPNNFGAYWYQGEAEVNSYALQQSRYGEERSGDAVLVFVTEDFSKSKQVKLDYSGQAGGDKVSVLKLNAIRKFKTGIYDYSMMESVFTPVDLKTYPHTFKTSTTAQDWCGHSFTQVNLQDKGYQVTEFSYFESEGDQTVKIGKVLLEDEIWTRLRINPSSIPEGQVEVLPAAFHSRLAHLKIEPKQARISIQEGEEYSLLQLDYLHLERSLSIQFETAFPHKIISWKENNGRRGITTGKLKKTLKTAYWSLIPNMS